MMITLREYFFIKIRPDKVSVENLKTRKFLQSEDGESFGNERLLITDTNEPEATLKGLLSQLSAMSLIKPSKTIILNPYHPNIPAFTEVEKMIMRDLAVQVGARNVHFIFGEHVTAHQIDLDNLAASTEV